MEELNTFKKSLSDKEMTQEAAIALLSESFLDIKNNVSKSSSSSELMALNGEILKLKKFIKNKTLIKNDISSLQEETMLIRECLNDVRKYKEYKEFLETLLFS